MVQAHIVDRTPTAIAMIFIAFLRGINVSGQKIIKMEALRACFVSLGFEKVKTYIQSGNVLFDAREKDPKKIAKRIEKGLKQTFRMDVRVAVISQKELQEVVKKKPKKTEPTDEIHWYVACCADTPVQDPKLPLKSPKGDVEVFQREGDVLFCKSFKVNGKFGFPNAFVEASCNVAATTRNWNTIQKMASLEPKNA